MDNLIPYRSLHCRTLALVVVTVLWLALVTVLLMLPPAPPAHADSVITNCTETGLINALASGNGLITFSCGPNPVVITVTQVSGINAASGTFHTIGGGNLVTLTGAHAHRLFDVRVNAALTLSNIILTDGYQDGIHGNLPDLGGAILDEGVSLTLDHVTIRNSQSITAGGAIEIITGTVLVRDSLIEGNQSGSGGGIDSAGSLTLRPSLTLVNTTVRFNHATNLFGGGLDLAGPTVISNSQIYSNTAGGGGGLRNSHTLVVVQSGLRDNMASAYGGGILNWVTGTLTVNSSTFSGNSAGSGGGFTNFFGLTSLSDSTLEDNSANYGGGIENYGTLALSNSTLSGNRAKYNGGGIENQETANVYNATIVFNQADAQNTAAGSGGGIYNLPGNTFNLRNSLVAGNRQGNGTNDCNGTFGTYGRNLFYVTADCTLVNGAGGSWSFLSTLAGIGPLLNNGGPTRTHLPRLGSQMIDGGDAVAGCKSPTGALLLADQRGKTRPIDGDGNGSAICDVGAVERQANDVDLSPSLWLPLVVR